MVHNTPLRGFDPDARRAPGVHGLLPFALTIGLLAGCANSSPKLGPQPGLAAGALPRKMETRPAAVAADPIAYLRRVARKCSALDQYTLTFTRHERRGLFQRLHGPEPIACWFRREPFSIRMKWLDEDVKYGESVYVAGQADNKVRFVTRWWSPPLLPPPRVNKVNLYAPIALGEAQQPLTDFGLERLMERTLKSLDEAGDEVTVEYRGPTQLPDGGPTTHFIHLEYPPTRHRAPIQELYIDVATDLPAATILKRPTGRIHAAYFYADLDTSVQLTDDDFILDAERPAHERQEKQNSAP